MSEQSPHEAAWNAAHRQAWIAAATQALITYAPLAALLRDIRGTRDGDPRAANRLARRYGPRFKLFPSVRVAVTRIAREQQRSRADVKHDAVLFGVTQAVQDEAARQLPVAAYLAGWLPKQTCRVAQADLLEQATFELGVVVPGLDDSTFMPMDEELLEQGLKWYSPQQQELIRLLAVEGLSFAQVDAVMDITAAERRVITHHIRRRRPPNP